MRAQKAPTNESSGDIGFQNEPNMEAKMIPGGSRKGSWKPSRIKTYKTKICTLFAMFQAHRTPPKILDVGGLWVPKVSQNASKKADRKNRGQQVKQNQNI